MQRAFIVGSFVGLLVTAAAAYFIFISRDRSSLPTPGTSSVVGTRDSENLPLVSVAADYQTSFPGRTDLIAHRASLKTRMKLETWDKFTSAWGSSSLKISGGCSVADVSHAIFIPPSFAGPMINGEFNVWMVNGRIPRCYARSSRVAVVVDDAVGNSTLYRVIGEATINRVLEFWISMEGPAFKALLAELGLSFEDATYLLNTDEKSFSADGLATVVHISFSSQKPILDPSLIPNFVPGAEVIKPESITRYFQIVKFPKKPVFVDTRMRRGNTQYPGAVWAPFIASNALQTRYRLDLPISVLDGAKFDTSGIPVDRETPLLIFGSDSTDTGPLWMIRNLQLQNYVNLYYIEGGMKALLESRTPISF